MVVESTGIAIIGAGFSGLGAGIKLKESGREDFVILERASDVGGTWRDNTYPGCACDIPSNLYSFSFAPNPDWSRSYPSQPEIWEYLRGCARRYGLLPHIRFDTDVSGADWDADAQQWALQTPAGEVRAQVLIAAPGGLSNPKVPDLPGLDGFEGAAFHSARWDHAHDLTGERVAVVGTGASAIQFVPQIQPRVGRLHLFQRTPPWVIPRRDHAVSERARRLYRRVPAAQKLVRGAIYAGNEAFVPALMGNEPFRAVGRRIARAHLRRQVPDPALRAKLEPRYEIGCKRVLVGDDYYPSLIQPNVEVLTEGVAEVRRHSVVGTAGTEREVDAILFGTGFHVTDMPLADCVRGTGGRSLRDVWGRSMWAYRGTSVAGFPNLFFVTGPNTGLGHNSIVYMIESQLAYLLDALRTMDARGAGAVEVRPEAERAYNDWLDRRLEGTVWNEGGCASWYLDETGRNAVIWPGFTYAFRRGLARFDEDAYELSPRVPAREPVAA